MTRFPLIEVFGGGPVHLAPSGARWKVHVDYDTPLNPIVCHVIDVLDTAGVSPARRGPSRHRRGRGVGVDGRAQHAEPNDKCSLAMGQRQPP